MVATWYASSPNFSVSATVEFRLRLPRHYDHIFVFKQMEHSVPSFLSQHHQSDHPVLMGTIPVRNNPMEFQVPWNSIPWPLHRVSVDRSSMGSIACHGVSMEFHRVPWNVHGVPWTSMGFY